MEYLNLQNDAKQEAERRNSIEPIEESGENIS